MTDEYHNLIANKLPPEVRAQSTQRDAYIDVPLSRYATILFRWFKLICGSFSLLLLLVHSLTQPRPPEAVSELHLSSQLCLIVSVFLQLYLVWSFLSYCKLAISH